MRDFLSLLHDLLQRQGSGQEWASLQHPGLHRPLRPHVPVEAGGQQAVRDQERGGGGLGLVLVLHGLCQLPASRGDQGPGEEAERDSGDRDGEPDDEGRDVRINERCEMLCSDVRGLIFLNVNLF